MKIFYTIRIIISVVFFYISIPASLSQANSEIWSEITDKSISIGERSGLPKEYRAFRLDFPAMINLLNNAVIDSLPDAYTNGPVISIPMPDGSLSKFRVAYTPVMEPALAEKFPMIKTFTAKGIDDTLAIARLDYTQWGFHALIISPDGWIIVDPASLGNTSEYITFNRSNSVATQAFVCGTEEVKQFTPVIDNTLYRSSGTSLRTYRLALACTGEYASYYGGTISGAASGMVTSVNRVTQVYESELSIRLTLIANNNSLIYTNSSTDPYTNSNGSTMLGQNQTNIDAVIGSANYDIGHVFSTGGGGVAYLGSVCSSTNKARGVTGQGAPIGDNFDIDYVAHEIGHQFGANHTFNSVTSSCNGNRASSAAYEPGSGTTIMAYAGICGADNIQPHSDAIFHTKSYDEIQIFTTTGNGNNCDVSTPTGNIAPVVTLPANKTIPKLTSFTLTGSATDANGDPLTYLWEEFDLGTGGSPNSPSGNAPIFRVFTPVISPSRTFPRIQDIVRNTQTLGEILPSYARSLTFRFTARDNRLNGGGVMHDDNVVTLTVVDPGDTFKVTMPNTNVSWLGGTANTVTWKVAGTNASPVNCANVNILLSTDSGYTFPYTLATNTPNDGSESVMLPSVTSTRARIKVESVGNVFFDISNVNFTINPGSATLTTITTGTIASSDLCAGFSVSVPFSTDGPANAGNIFTAQLSNSSGSFASPVNIGTLSATTSGTISALIPTNTPAGTSYRIRVISSNPPVTGSNNGTNLRVYLPPAAAGSISGTAIVCAGQTGIVYSVPPIANATEYTWTVPANVSITSGSTTNSITVSFLNNATSGSFSVSGNNNGCVNGTVSPLFNVTVNPVPVAAGTISGITSICPGQSGVIFSVPAISGATGYNWTLPTGATIVSGSNTNSVTINFSLSSVSGNVTVSGTNTCGAGTASSLVISILTIQSPINVSANGPVNFCSGGSVDLSYVQSANSVYQWRKDGLAIAGETGASYNVSTSGIYDVIGDTIKSYENNDRISIPDNNCTGVTRVINVSGYTGAVISSGITVKINITHTYVGDLAVFLQAPNGTFLGLSNQRGGSGDNFTNTIFSDAGSATLPTSAATAPFTGTYKPSGVFTSCTSSTLATFGAIGGGSINPNGNWILHVYDRAGVDTGSVHNWTLNLPASLNSPCVKTSNATTVTVSPSVVAGVSISSNSSTTICQGTNVTFTATPANGGTTPTYQWKINGANAGSNIPTFNTSSLANGNTITCVMTSNASCVSNNPATSNGIIMTVNPVVTASVSIAANTSTTICTGTNVTFTASPVNGGTTPSFQWRIGTTNVGGNSPTYSNASLVSGNVVSCVMTSNATCVSGSPAISNALTFTVNQSVAIASFSPSAGGAGTVITINGSGFTNATAVLFNNINASFSIINNNTISATVPAGNTSGTITVNGCGQAISSSNFNSVQSVSLELKVMIEGLQTVGGQMNSVLAAGVSDTVQVSLASTTAPHAILASVKMPLDLSGEAIFIFPGSVFNQSLYIVVDHRNCLQTWSALPMVFSDSIMQYDFTTSATKAYGNNQMNMAGVYVLYSGDVNKDGVIDLNDISNITQHAELFTIGYFPEDLDGNRMIESSDYSLVENNLLKVVLKP